MKKIVIAFMSLLMVGAFTEKSFAQEEITNGAKIEFQKEMHDYGEVAYAGNGTTTFKFKNTGNAPLIISDAKKSCGCTVPQWPREPIAPGETGEIKVKYDTKRAGAINKSVSIMSNAVNAPTKVIRIKGTVLPKPEAPTLVNNSGPVTK